MKRREFITLLGGAAAAPLLAWPLAARAQQPSPALIARLERQLGRDARAAETGGVVAAPCARFGYVEGDAYYATRTDLPTASSSAFLLLPASWSSSNRA